MSTSPSAFQVSLWVSLMRRVGTLGRPELKLNACVTDTSWSRGHNFMSKVLLLENTLVASM